MLRSLLVLLALTGFASSQTVTWLGSVGVAQSVPDPFFTTNPPGNVFLAGLRCLPPAPLFKFEVTGIPIGYNHGAINYESIWFIFDFGASALPGLPILQGQIYLPLIAQIAINDGASMYIGPPDIVCPGATGAGLGLGRNGALINLTNAIYPGLMGTFSMQALLLDPVAGRIFTSNALNFQIL